MLFIKPSDSLTGETGEEDKDQNQNRESFLSALDPTGIGKSLDNWSAGLDLDMPENSIKKVVQASAPKAETVDNDEIKKEASREWKNFNNSYTEWILVINEAIEKASKATRKECLRLLDLAKDEIATFRSKGLDDSRSISTKNEKGCIKIINLDAHKFELLKISQCRVIKDATDQKIYALLSGDKRKAKSF